MRRALPIRTGHTGLVPDPKALLLPGKARTPTGSPAQRGAFLFSVVEVEILRRLLLEPEAIVIGGVLKEVRRLLEDVVVGVARRRGL